MAVDWIALRRQRTLEESPKVWVERVHSFDIRAGVTTHKLKYAFGREWGQWEEDAGGLDASGGMCWESRRQPVLQDQLRHMRVEMGNRTSTTMLL